MQARGPSPRGVPRASEEESKHAAARGSESRSIGPAVALAALGGVLLPSPPTTSLLAISAPLSLVLLALAGARSRSVAHAALCGLTFGTAANALALFALVGLLARFSHLPDALCWAISALAWVAHALPYALASAVAHWARGDLDGRADTHAHPLAWLGLPLALVPALALTPQLFPWHPAGALADVPALIQLAELGGEPLLGFVLTLAASALAVLVDALIARERIPRGPLCALIAAVGLTLGYGYLRLPALATLRARAPLLRVGVAQSNVGVDRKHDERTAAAQLRTLRSLTRALEQRGVDLTVWGETAYPYPLLRSTTHAPGSDSRARTGDTAHFDPSVARAGTPDPRALLGADVRGPLLIGVETYEGFDPRAAKYNSAWLVTPTGRLGDRVDKARLLPFGEYVPLWSLLPALRARFAHPGFSPGSPGIVHVSPRAEPAARAALGVLICYEDLFAASARSTVRAGARALINLGNDAWFGDTRAPHLHELTTRLRAVELRRDLVRALNTGVSSFTTATGETAARTAIFHEARLVADVRLLDVATPWARFGDWVTPLCLVALALIASKRAQRRASKESKRAQRRASKSWSRAQP